MNMQYMRNLIMNTVKEAKSLVARIEEKQGGISIFISSSIDQNNLVMLYLPYRAHIGNVLVYPCGESHNYITFEIDWYKAQIKNVTNGFDIEVHNSENTSIHCLLKVRLSGCVFEGQRNIEHKNVAESFAFNRPYFPPFKIFIAGKEDSSLYNKKQIFEIILKRFPEFEPCILTNPAGFDPDLSLKYVAESDCLLFLFEPTSNWSYTEYKYAMGCKKKVLFVVHNKIIRKDVLDFFDHYPAPQEEISCFADDNYVSLLNGWMDTLATVRKQNFSKNLCTDRKNDYDILKNGQNCPEEYLKISDEPKLHLFNTNLVSQIQESVVPTTLGCEIPEESPIVFKKEDDENLFTEEIQTYILEQLNGRKIRPPIKPLSGGLAGSEVYCIDVDGWDTHNTGWHVVKLSNSVVGAKYLLEERNKCQNILENAGEAFEEHLVKSNVYYHNGLQIIRCDYGEDYLDSDMLCNLPVNLKDRYAEDISYDLLTKWNKGKSNNDCVDGDPVYSFFSTLLGKRIDENGKFKQWIEELLEYPQRKIIKFSFCGYTHPNPYYYITHMTKLAEIITTKINVNFIQGKTHGDLHSQNIICSTLPNKAKYTLIDYTHYNPQSFVLYDHALLEVDAYYRFLKDKDTREWMKHLSNILDEYTTSSPKIISCNHELLTFRNAITAGILRWEKENWPRNSANIRIQFACARVASGIKHLCSPFVENYKQAALMLYYTSLCLRQLFRVVKYGGFSEYIGETTEMRKLV
ncbi:MAG: hypothetical protein LBC03_03005 [Nitrososphaerota archaeon]|nr:hypothetical protein [Nitrososphaerota archaeon]